MFYKSSQVGFSIFLLIHECVIFAQAPVFAKGAINRTLLACKAEYLPWTPIDSHPAVIVTLVSRL